jgi:predicted dehydrogenase
MFKILLVGCGQLGSRHLQAIASLQEVREVHVVDVNPQALELGRTRLKEISDLNPEITFRWSTEFTPDSRQGDLCIIPTQARGRSALMKKIVTECRYNHFLVEKIVTQSMEEYQDLLNFVQENQLSVWVNCKSRAYGIHKYIKSRLNPDDRITFQAAGGNHGLANNGIHEVDLFVFHDGAKKIERLGSRIHPSLLPSKRGSDLFDLSGTLWGCSDKGSMLTITFAPEHVSPDHISIVSAHSRFIVDHFQQFAYESYADENWQWRRIPVNENWTVSHMTKTFVRDILSKGCCDLPSLADCFAAHEFILQELQPQFNRLLNQNNSFCPVT